MSEQRKETKNAINMARTRKQRRDASKRYQELNREVMRGHRRDKSVYVESDAKRAEGAGKRSQELRLSGRFQSTCNPVRNEASVLLRTVEEEMHRWRDHFEGVLGREEPPNLLEVEPSDELNIREGNTANAEIKTL